MRIPVVFLLFLSLSAGQPSENFDDLSRRAHQQRDAGHISEAIDLYQKALKLQPEWDEGWWYAGTLLYSADRNDEAIAAFNEVLKKHPRNGAAWAFKGLCEFGAGDRDSALQSLENARTFGVGDNAQLISATRYTLGALLTKAGRFDDALRELETLARHDQENEDVLRALGTTALLLPYLPSELPDQYASAALAIGRAVAQAASNDRAAAAQTYAEAVKKYGTIPNVHYTYGTFLLRDQADKAVEEFRRELAQSPSHVPSRLQLIAEYIRRGEYTSALPLARESVDLAPDSYLTHQMLGRTLIHLDDVDSAIPELQHAIELNPSDPSSHFQLARAYRIAGRSVDAARENAEFMRLDKARTQAPAPDGGGPKQ